MYVITCTLTVVPTCHNPCANDNTVTSKNNVDIRYYLSKLDRVNKMIPMTAILFSGGMQTCYIQPINLKKGYINIWKGRYLAWIIGS